MREMAVRHCDRRMLLCLLSLAGTACADRSGSAVPGVNAISNAVTADPTLPGWLRYAPSGVGLPQQSTGRLGRGQDPGIVFFDGAFYLVQAAGGSVLTVYRSTDLETLMTDETYHWEMTRELVDNVEAPDIDIITDPTDGRQKLGIYITKVRPWPGFIKVVVTEDPAEGFEDKGYLKGVNGYDAHYLEHPNGNAYLFYSDFSTLQIIQMSDPWTTEGGNVTISHAYLPWEMNNDYPPIVEAPATVISGDTLNLIYSSNNWASIYYVCGRITASLDSDPMDPSSWTKDTAGPVFTSSNGLYGPGSGTFFDDGLHQWWSYGCFNDSSHVVRHIRAQTVTFDSDGAVVLGEPV